MTQTERNLTPLEGAILKATCTAAGMAASLSTDAAIRQLIMLEGEMVRLGGGAPTYTGAVELGIRWSDMSALSLGDA